MSMRVNRDLAPLHPLLREIHTRIGREVIDTYKAPFRLFETGRIHERHQGLLNKGRTKDAISKHLFNLDNDPPLYATAFDYVYYNGKWSWNLRDNTIKSWYVLFGNIVLDVCPELKWGGELRKNVNYTHFELRGPVVASNVAKYPCVIP